MKTEIKSHSEVIAGFMSGIRQKVCQELMISPDAYYMMHYDLAYQWLERKDFYEFIALVYVVSPAFHRWWNQQLAQEEQLFLSKWGRVGLFPRRMREILESFILDMDVKPSPNLRRTMFEEGMQIIKNNPDLKAIKLYRHGRLGTEN